MAVEGKLSNDHAGAKEHESNIIPQEILFAYQKEQARLSPDGLTLAYLAPSPDHVLNVWVRPLEGTEEEAKMVTFEKRRGVHFFIWNPSGEYIIYKVDNGGCDDHIHFSIEVATGEKQELTPLVGVCSKLIPSSISGLRPYEMLFCMNIREASDFDVYKVNIKSGEAVLDTQNPGDVSDWVCDGNGVVRGALAFDLLDGSQTVRVRDSLESEWRDVLRWSSLDSGSLAGFGPKPNQIYVATSMDSPTTRLLLINTDDGSIVSVIASDPKIDYMPIKFDPSKVMVMDLRTKEYLAVGFFNHKLEWKVVHPSVQEDFDLLTSFRKGNMYVGSRDRTNQKWVVTYESDDCSSETYLYQRESKELSLLFQHHPQLNEYKLGKTHSHIIKSRDGLNFLVYLTLPPGIEPKNLPLVLRIHGGPWYRDWWGWDAENQFWATRGYACLQMQYRGSEGFGKEFMHAGDKQWAGDMQNDITDSVHWAIAEGYADKDRVGITGISFGGFCTLAGITFTPELYKCAAELVGPSQLFTVTKYIVPYWKPRRKLLNDRVVDLTKDEELNKKRSPVFYAKNVQVPLIMAHGKNDVIVNPGESERMFQALKVEGKEVQYLIYQEEGHFLERPQDKMDWFSRVEVLFHKHLGGQIGPIATIVDSTVQIIGDFTK